MNLELQLNKPGNNSYFNIRETDSIKDLKSDQVRIDVNYSGINFADILMGLGLYPEAPKAPFTPGYEVSGVVTEVGSDVNNFKVGDKVLAGTYFGGYSSEVIVSDWQVMALPESLDLKEGAAIGVSYFTAYLALFKQARVSIGEKIFIDCLTGSLGQMCLMLLKDMNCEIHGLTSSKEKVELFKEKGIKLYLWDEFIKEEQEYDFILNSRAGESMKVCYNRLKPNGRMVFLGISSVIEKGKKSYLKVLQTLLKLPLFPPFKLMNDNKGVYGLNVLKFFEYPEDLKEAISHLNNFDIQPNISKVFHYKEIKNAFEFIQSKQSTGKVLIDWDKN